MGHAAGASIDSQDTLAFSALSGVRPMIDRLNIDAYHDEPAADREPVDRRRHRLGARKRGSGTQPPWRRASRAVTSPTGKFYGLIN